MNQSFDSDPNARTVPECKTGSDWGRERATLSWGNSEYMGLRAALRRGIARVSAEKFQ
jgi:hypothetical protein